MTKLQSQVLEEARGAFDRGLAAIVSAVEREMLRRQAEPVLWARFHRLMSERLAKVRWLARFHHRRMALRYEALADAQAFAAVARCEQRYSAAA
jgi:hypothetical protein